MPACWKHLEEQKPRDVAALIGSFYDESKADWSKEPWALPNIKKFLNIGYVKLYDLAKLRTAYLETQGNNSVFVETTFIDSSADDTTKVEDNDVLLGEHDGFSLKPKKLIKEFQHKPGYPKAQGNIFLHYTNYTATAHCVASAIEKKNGRLIDIEPTAGLNVEVSELQRSLLNTTYRDMIVSDIIDQAKGERENNKEVKRKQCFMTWNINSYSRILNNDKSMELIVDYNDMFVGLEMSNAEKYVNAKELAAKKVEEAEEMAKNKAAKNTEETNKYNEMLPELQAELQKHVIDGILNFPGARMQQYICYLFKNKVVNFSNTEKYELKVILSTLLEHHYALMQKLRILLLTFPPWTPRLLQRIQSKRFKHHFSYVLESLFHVNYLIN